MMNLRTALDQGTDLLEGGGIPDARLTAQALLSHALGRDRTFLYTHPERELSTVEWIHFGHYLHERLRGKPLQYITKSCEFYGRPFRVTPDVLIPRPETEHVIERALVLAADARRIADVCTGAGILAITLALELHPDSVVASDLSAAAIEVARANAAALDAPVEFTCCDLLGAITGSFDLIVANPPYVTSGSIESLEREVRDHEPRLALDGGPDGLDVYRRLIPQAWDHLAQGGWFIIEIGFDQGGTVPALFTAGWSSVQVTNDLAGHPRVVEARKHQGAMRS
jgi:release factor glutamine methyltransferase